MGPQDQPGWLAYDALVMLQESRTKRRWKDTLERYRLWFHLYFDGFGDKNPDDTYDAGD